MKKTVLGGICQTLILMIALFLISVQVLQFMSVTEMVMREDESGTISQTEIDAIIEVNQGMASSDTARDRIIRMINDSPRLSGLFYTAMFLLIAVTCIPDLFPWGRNSGKARTWILVNTALYLGCGLPFLIMGYTSISFIIMNFLYSVILIAESVAKLRQKHSKGRVIMRILLIILTLANLAVLCFLPYFVLVIIILRAIKQILVISFSQIRLDVLKKIIRKTYASEILLGMILLMAAFSLLLSMLDPNISSFADGLWFCFATVTTIGYGDVTASTLIGRVLSVILGIYGIVVVALITSIIVNFYNEMKTENTPENEPEGKQAEELP